MSVSIAKCFKTVGLLRGEVRLMNKEAAGKGTKPAKQRSFTVLPDHNTVPKSGYVLLLLLFIVAAYFTRYTANPGRPPIIVMGSPAPLTAFTGVFSWLSSICIIFMVVFYGKFGFFSALFIQIAQIPMLLVNVFVRHIVTSIPGIYSNLFTIIAILIIYFNARKVNSYQKKLRDQAVKDSLTDLPNGFACRELMKDLVRRKARFAVVSVDLNNFVNINDTMGHAVGNKVILEVSDRWVRLAESWKTGTYDFVGHLGGDVYSIVIQGFTSCEDVENSINEYEKELEKKITIDDCDYFMTACFGYAIYPEDAANMENVVSGADAALHTVKHQKNADHVKHFTSDLLKTEHKLEMERKIRGALDNDRVFFNLQPQYDINHKLRGFEALARMTDAEGSLIGPGDFIPVAEETGLVDRIDNRIFIKSAEFVSRMIRGKGADITLSINVSVKHLMKNNFLDEIKEVISSTGIPADHLEIEITESVMIDSMEEALARLDEAKKMGIKIAIDDFGTGYSSLSYLNSFPADLLKIDKSFIDVMNTSESSKRYVSTIVSIGHVLGLEVISEGVEMPDQLETLKDIGCDYIQGFIWGRPLSAEDAEKVVESSI